MAKYFMRILGGIFLLLGIIGFFLPLEGSLDLTLTHNIFHIATGAFLLAFSWNERTSALGAKLFGAVYLVLSVIGFFTQDFLGLMLMPADTAMHLLMTIAFFYVGFKVPGQEVKKTKETSV
ncbi:DUF4383 domain-containing protein [Camelliibacillus cellulosilyticus]|uniref:DUF4383 domain-containing protein n=1 Tax=Camelliibacillus cellulosilyticus TaxID=2174486 RepID=A0ABV9GNM6_9BACL